ANTYSGGTTLSGGSLNINNATALGTGAFTIAAGTTIDNTSAAAITLSSNNAQTWNGDFTFIGTNSLNMGTGAITFGTTSTTPTITVSGSTLTEGGAISGSTTNTITKNGAGTLTLTGNTGTSGNWGSATAGSTITVSAGTLLADGNLNTTS